MKNFISACIFSLCVFAFPSCKFGLEESFGRGDTPGSRLYDTPTLPLISPLGPATGSFRFIVSADLHFGSCIEARPERIASFQALIDAENPSFAAFCGDLTETGTEAEYVSFRNFTNSLTRSALSGGGSLPWVALPGNHDLYNSGWQLYRSYVGPNYFRIEVGPVSLYGLDSANGTLGQAQLNRLKADFRTDQKPKIVFTHYPVRGNDSFLYYRMTNPRERIILLDLFARNNVKAVFVGHWHYPYFVDCGPFQERISGSFADSTDDMGYCWIVDVDVNGNITAVKHSL